MEQMVMDRVDRQKEQKQEEIIRMFDDIAGTYDLANRVLSLGIDIKWRQKSCKKALSLLNKKEIGSIVDVATGTGDLLLMWRKIATKKGIEVQKFIGIDPSSGMLDVARKKVDFAIFEEAKAQQLPVEDESCDIVSIAFGIRNVVEPVLALSEFYRILRPGGLAVILEFTKNDRSGMVDKMVDFGMKKVLPLVGGLISKNYEAYRYLPDSIESFLTTETLEQMLSEAGLAPIYRRSFSMGIATLIIAKKER